MELKIKDRLMLADLYPKESDLVTQILVRDVRNKVQLTQEEIKELDFKVEKTGYIWNEKKDKGISVDFTDAELEMLKAGVIKINKDKKVTPANLNICELISKYKPEPIKESK